jgi:diguanylate cyclase (GGDEF)-like protein
MRDEASRTDLARQLSLARQAEFLRALPEEALRRLLAKGQVRAVAAGDPIFEDGEDGRSMFVVLSGEILVHKHGRQIATGGPGQYFGEMALIEGKPRSAGIEALSDAVVLEISAESFSEHVLSSADALMAMLKTMANRSRHDLGALAASNEQLHRYTAAMEHANRELTDVRRELEEKNRQLERLSTHDALTGIPNRRRFDATLEQEWRRATREASPLSLALCDIDYFKGYNDTYGHQEGDECLARVARALAETFRRPGDLVARYGGEEFVSVLPGTTQKGAAVLAERMRAAVEALQIPHRSSPLGSVVTISVGVATVVPPPGSEPESLVDLADRALYAAKQKGRNRVEAARATPEAARTPPS